MSDFIMNDQYFADLAAQQEIDGSMMVGCGACLSTYTARQMKWDWENHKFCCRDWPKSSGTGFGRGGQIGEVKYERIGTDEWSEYFDVGQEAPDQ